MTKPLFTEAEFIAAVKDVIKTRGPEYVYPAAIRNNTCTYRGAGDPGDAKYVETNSYNGREVPEPKYVERCLFGEALIDRLKVPVKSIREGKTIMAMLELLGFPKDTNLALHEAAQLLQDRQDRGETYGKVARETIFAD